MAEEGELSDDELPPEVVDQVEGNHSKERRHYAVSGRAWGLGSPMRWALLAVSCLRECNCSRSHCRVVPVPALLRACVFPLLARGCDAWFPPVLQAFQARIATAPEQCLRYCFHESAAPLCPSPDGVPSADDVPPCPRCGGPRIFEFQVRRRSVGADYGQGAEARHSAGRRVRTW